MHATAQATPPIAYALTGKLATIAKPPQLLGVRGVEVRKATGEVVSVECVITASQVTIKSNVDLTHHTAIIF